VNQKEINAFALPGGPIYVNLGTIQAADNEAQLAGVIGHEIGHVVMRHSTNQVSKQQGIGILAGVLGSRAGGGIGGQLLQMGIGLGAGSVLMKFSRSAESQADLVGADLIHDAGYNPQAMVDFFHKLEEQGGSRGPQFFSDHPNPGNRATAVGKEVATLPKTTYQNDSAEFRRIKQKVAGMKAMSAEEAAAYAKNQQAGGNAGTGSTGGTVTKSNSVYPSSNMVTASTNTFSISRPDNWEVHTSQTGVAIAPAAGVSGGNIAYGVLIDNLQSNGGTLEQMTEQLVKGIAQSNPGTQQLGSTEAFKLKGQKALSTVLQGNSPVQGEKERDWLVTTLRSDGSLVQLVFVAPESDFKKLQPTFENMLRSLTLK